MPGSVDSNRTPWLRDPSPAFGWKSAGRLQRRPNPTANGLIATRALMGVGAAVITPLTLSVLPSMFSDEERPRAVAVAMIANYLGLPLGPVVAG
jgi:MFS family permease